MNNGMPPTSGHSGKVRGCCQAPVPADPSFLCSQQICRWCYMGYSCLQWHMSAIFALCYCITCLNATNLTRIQYITPWKLHIQLHRLTDEQNRKTRKTVSPHSAHMPSHVLFPLPFLFFDWADFGFHSGAYRCKKGFLAHCWFKILAEQIWGWELRAMSWPFCSLLSSANFFLGLSESIKELPECSHQSFNYSW